MLVNSSNKKEIYLKISACCKEKNHGTILVFSPENQHSLIIKGRGEEKYSNIVEQNFFVNEIKKIAKICTYYLRTEVKIDFVPVLSDPFLN